MSKLKGDTGSWAFAPPAWRVWLLVLTPWLFSSGCSGVPTTPARQLPPELAATTPRSPGTLDLSRLSSPRAPSDVLQPGDQLELTVATGVPEADFKKHPVRLDAAGNAHLPLVGPVQLAGLRVPDAERSVQMESIRRGIYRQPQVALQVSQRQTHRITVAGAVEKPGVKEIPSASADLFTALSEAGRFQKDADTIVEITYPPQPDGQGQIRPGSTTRLDLAKAVTEGGEYPLPDGVAIMVRRKSPQTIHVDGLVKTPKRIELPFDREYRLLDAISEAGGRRLSLADRVYVSRIDPGGKTRVIQASYKQAIRDDRENLVLTAGDVVTVQDTPATFAIEMMRSFIRVGFSSAVPGF